MFLASRDGDTSCQITVGLEDEKMLRIIPNKIGGSIKLRSGAKAIRYRLKNKAGMIDLVNRGDGWIRNSKRLPQWHQVGQILNMDALPPIILTENSSWFAGFLDADGTIHFYYQKKPDNITIIRPQWTLSVTNKYLQDIIYYIFGGHIYYDSAPLL